MGSQVEWVGPADPALRTWLVRHFAAYEQTLSRFREDSELSALNRAGGRPFAASARLFAVVAAAWAAHQTSGGDFDPTILAALEQAGYDRDFADLMAGNVAAPPRRSLLIERVRDTPLLRLDPVRRQIRLAPGVRLDLGGIGKGWTVDMAVRWLRRQVPAFLLSAGGDLYAAGEPAPSSGWKIGVENPHQPGTDLTTLTVRDRAVATSGAYRRRWWYAGRPAHHLIDPQRGVPADSDLLAVTVVADTVTRAEIAAKVAFLRGMAAGKRYLEAQAGLAGLLIGVDGTVDWTPGLSSYFAA